MAPRYLTRIRAAIDEAISGVAMPYGMNEAGIVRAVNDVYSYLHAVNRASIQHGYDRLEDFMQPAGFSGMLSHLFVRSVAREFGSSSPGLAVNQYPNGRPDLVPRAFYPNDRILQGEEGVEVKVSRARSGWQGHNPESGWILIVQVEIDTRTEPIFDRFPTAVKRAMIAYLEEEDWTFSGRGSASRRTPTASINLAGRKKLEYGTVYYRND